MTRLLSAATVTSWREFSRALLVSWGSGLNFCANFTVDVDLIIRLFPPSASVTQSLLLDHFIICCDSVVVDMAEPRKASLQNWSCFVFTQNCWCSFVGLQESLNVHGDVSYTCETAGYFYLYQVSFHDLENRFHWEQIVWWGFMPFQRHARLKHKARTPTQTKREVVLDPRFRLRNRWKYSSNQLTLFGTQRRQSVSHDLHDFLHCSMHVFPQNTVSRWCLS